jgi:3D (Asp-Asp-Asp) domain-containing protein
MIKKYAKHLLLVGLITGLMATQVNDIAFAKEYETYTAVKGDCMWDISMEYDVDLAELLELNGMTEESILHIDQEVKIPDEEYELQGVVVETVTQPQATVEEYVQPVVEEYVQPQPQVTTGYSIGIFAITYYSAYDGTQIGITAGGTNMAGGNIYTNDGYRIIATDPSVIPLGTIVRVTTSNGESFLAKADDTGGAVKGNKIDIAVSSASEAFTLGRGTATIEILQ